MERPSSGDSDRRTDVLNRLHCNGFVRQMVGETVRENPALEDRWEVRDWRDVVQLFDIADVHIDSVTTT